MKRVITSLAITFLGCNASFAQEFIEPIDIGSLISGDEDKSNNLGDLFKRAGDVNKFDIVIVMYGEHMSDAVVMAFRGLKTGVVWPDEEKNKKCHALYVTRRPNLEGGREEKFEEEIPIDSPTHLALYELAWELAEKPKVDIQTRNLNKKFKSIESCYFLVNSRLHADSPILLGGYIQNPEDGTKSSKFLKMAYAVWSKWNKRGVNPGHR